jgi:uncharacterized LabA/DUF88 family protein
LSHSDRLNIAVFIDFDNIEIGVRTTLGQQFDVGTILDAIKERGEVITKIAYADWTRAGEYSRALTQHAIRLVQRNLTPGGDKNGADINLALDALEMAFTHPHINAYVIVGGDSDFLSLVEKLKQYDKKVFVVGGRAFTSMILQRNCHEFIAYENLAGVRKAAVTAGRPAATTANAPIAQAVPIVRRALKILADREVTPQTGLLKSTLLQLDSTFSERNYGASSFLDFVEKLAQAGLVSLKHAGRSVIVELNGVATEDAEASGQKTHTTTEGSTDSADAHSASTGVAPLHSPASGGERRGESENGAFRPAGDQPSRSNGSTAPVDVAPPVTESAEAGVKRAGQILAAATGARWPMYLRNVKQILRQHRGESGEPSFDERRYGFSGLLDLLKACQREGLVRIERDRRGGLRVFQGSGLSQPGQGLPRGTGFPPSPGQHDIEPGNAAPIESRADAPVDAFEPAGEVGEAVEPMPIDTTAELLGRAKHRKPRTSLSRPAAAAARKPAAKKPAARKPVRGRKSADKIGAEN